MVRVDKARSRKGGRSGRARARRRAQEAFTLFELMIIVAIIAITASLAMPAMHSAMAERKNSEAAYDLVRLMRHARAEALAYGRAHLVRFSPVKNGSFTVYRGISSNCNSNNWAPLIAAGICGDPASMCIDRISMIEGPDDGNGTYELGSTRVRASESTGLLALDLCYQPTGLLYHRRTPVGRFTDQNSVNGGYVFNFQRVDDGRATGVMRRVVVPMSGDPRVLR
jgi:type II secretory pathway pseudopilin PulG